MRPHPVRCSITLGIGTLLAVFMPHLLRTDAASGSPPLLASFSGSGPGDVADLLEAARHARYRASYLVQFSIPDLPPGQGPVATPPPLAEIAATMDWAIAPPQRRFDAQITRGAEHLTANRAQPGSIPNPEGTTPTFFFDGPAVVMCEERDGTAHCSEVPYDWAQLAMPLIGQSPVLFYPFVGEMSGEQIAQLAAQAQTTAPREVLGEPATCFTVALLGPLEACFSPAGVPVRIEALRGGFTLEATSYHLGADEAVFALPAVPVPASPEGLPRPGVIPLPPGVDPQDMARCLAETGDPARCQEELAPAP